MPVLRLFASAVFLTGTLAPGALGADAADARRIGPWSENPRFWAIGDEPVLLVGGSDDDNLFQWPDEQLDQQLDVIAAAGGNYVRNTMSDRQDKGFEVYPFGRRDDGKYDLEAWNPEYWRRFARFLDETERRGIVVQIEVWDRFDYSDNGGDRWQMHPYNPANNVNYTFAESGLAAAYPKHPGANDQPFFFTPPALDDNAVVRRFQERQVDKMLSIALRHGNVLYCIDNETNGREAWGAYWAAWIRRRAEEAGVSVCITEMWDAWDPKAAEHRQTLDHPEQYDFADVSQNNHNRGQGHWGNLAWVRAYVANSPRPLNTVKIYGADGGRYGNSRDGVERFWRNLFGGVAGTRFHRPDSGIGASDLARRQIHAFRAVEDRFDFFSATPDVESSLLRDREPNEAYATRSGDSIGVYFPARGDVTLRLPSKGRWKVDRLSIDEARWTGPNKVDGNSAPLTSAEAWGVVFVVQPAE